MRNGMLQFRIVNNLVCSAIENEVDHFGCGVMETEVDNSG
jgi:hypothetical protein